MKNECDVVKDLLLSYAEDLLSDNTNHFVKEHLDSCQECRKVYDGMKKINYNKQNVKKYGRKMKTKKGQKKMEERRNGKKRKQKK